jgi:lysophospholipase L1-like esterase
LPTSKILLLAIFPRGRKVDDPLRARNDKVNTIISKLHDGKTIHYLDIGHAFLNKDKTLNKVLIKDTVHPTEKGFEVWAEAMEPMITKLLKDAKLQAKPGTK